MSQPATKLAYEKGERRFKHVGRGAKADVQFDNGNPKKWVGKCPNNIPDELKVELLNKAIPAPSADAELSYVDRLFAVYEGVVYEAKTSDDGHTYHAYPYRGRLTKSVAQALKDRATSEGFIKEFKDWFAKHIEYGGKL